MLGQVLRIDFKGPLTKRDLTALADTLFEKESSMELTPDRITDVSKVTRMEIEFSDIWALVQRRRTRPPANPIKSAIVAATPVQLGFARMFQTLNDIAGIKIAIFPDQEAAQAWIEGN
ncbi:MAG TPA: hypothetical protein VGH90_11895 [Chthoniobacteraceae bacterium]